MDNTIIAIQKDGKISTRFNCLRYWKSHLHRHKVKDVWATLERRNKAPSSPLPEERARSCLIYRSRFSRRYIIWQLVPEAQSYPGIWTSTIHLICHYAPKLHGFHPIRLRQAAGAEADQVFSQTRKEDFNRKHHASSCTCFVEMNPKMAREENCTRFYHQNPSRLFPPGDLCWALSLAPQTY